MIEVLIVSSEEVLFKGQAERISFPGECGTFEVLPYHRPLVSRLLPGEILIDDQPLPLLRGVVTVGQHNMLTAIVETPQTRPTAEESP